MTINDDHKYLWLGVRESDIAEAECMFIGSVTMFGHGMDCNHSMEKKIGKRIDHNGECIGYNDFFLEEVSKIVKKENDIHLIPYDALDYKFFPEELQKYIMYRNEYGILERLNHKFYTKQHFSQIVDVIDYKLIHTTRCKKELLSSLFPNSRFVVVQRDFSCGGSGTYLVRADVGEQFKFSEDVIVTPYIENGVSVNVHCVIYENEIIQFPPSIQLIDLSHNKMEYLGSDYSAFEQLTTFERDSVSQTAERICRDLMKSGYRGICGLDLLLANEKCYFMEVNARFQASSALLNRNLIEHGYPTLLEYHMDAFKNTKSSFHYPIFDASGSFVNIHYRKKEHKKLVWLWNRIHESKNFRIVDDALDWDRKLDDNCYAFQIHSKRAISSVTVQHTVRIHPNVGLTTLYINSTFEYDNIFRLKFLMLARGVRITTNAWNIAEKKGGVDWFEFGAVTIQLPNKAWITAPCIDKWHELSPLEIDVDSDDNFVLLFYGIALMPVHIMPADDHAELMTSKGHYFRDIVYMNPDRLRVYHRDGCIYQNLNMGCKFCDLFGTGKKLDFDEICEAIDFYWKDLVVDHFLIGGGSGSKDEEYKMVEQIAKYIHAHCDKHIYLMCTPICDIDRLKKLKNAGITEVSFNIEIFDPTIRKIVMPGKSKLSVDEYMKSLKNAAKVFGEKGEVRSAVIVGFDDPDTFAAGIRRICEAGAAPILSLYRMGEDTALKNYMPIGELEAIMYYNIANSIASEYGLKLGPSCKACQNNTLALEL